MKYFCIKDKNDRYIILNSFIDIERNSHVMSTLSDLIHKALTEFALAKGLLLETLKSRSTVTHTITTTDMYSKISNKIDFFFREKNKSKQLY